MKNSGGQVHPFSRSQVHEIQHVNGEQSSVVVPVARIRSFGSKQPVLSVVFRERLTLVLCSESLHERMQRVIDSLLRPMHELGIELTKRSAGGLVLTGQVGEFRNGFERKLDVAERPKSA